MSEIQSAGDLRNFLAEVMEGVRDGSIDPLKADRIAKLASQINESFYAETVVEKGRQGRGLAANESGSLPLGHASRKEAMGEVRRIEAGKAA